MQYNIVCYVKNKTLIDKHHMIALYLDFSKQFILLW